MGGGAVLDPRPGGEFRLYISGVPVVGQYVEVDPPRRVVITWGREGSASFPAGASTLEVTLLREPTARSSRSFMRGSRRPRPASTRSDGPTTYRDSPRPLREATPVRIPGRWSCRERSPHRGGPMRDGSHRRTVQAPKRKRPSQKHGSPIPGRV